MTTFDETFLLLFSVLFACIIGNWARNWNRSFGVWAVLSFILSPFITSVALLIVGRSDE